MSGRIPLLDTDERAAICSALDGELPGAWSAAHIDRIIAAINGLRYGEPVGTVKRSDAGAIALRCTELAPRPWVIMFPNGELLPGGFTDLEMSRWPVIYRPEADK